MSAVSLYDAADVRRKHMHSAVLMLAIIVAMTAFLQVEDVVARGLAVAKRPFVNLPGFGVSLYGEKPEFDVPPFSYAAAAPALLPPVDRSKAAQTVPVLVYHGIVPNRDRYSISVATFREQMTALKNEGYSTLTLEQYNRWLKGGLVPERSVLVTFDDGRRDSWVQADVVLKELGFHAVMFIATDSSLHPDSVKGHGRYYVEGYEVKEMAESGRWSIGSHAVQETGGWVALDGVGTKGQFLSNRAWLTEAGRMESEAEFEARVGRELGESKKLLEDLLGQPVVGMSYPFGDAGDALNGNHDGAAKVVAKVVAEHYDLAFRQIWPTEGYPYDNSLAENPLRLKRVEVPTDWTGSRLVTVLAGSAAKDLPWSAESFASDADWLHQMGTVTAQDGKLLVAATANETGADAFLNGSQLWTDYVASAGFEWVGGKKLSFIVRYQDPQNYAACIFGDGHARFEAREGGIRAQVVDVTNKAAWLGGAGNVGAVVHGSTVSCQIDGRTAVSGRTNVGVGGVGVRAWDPAEGGASVAVTSLRVAPLQ